MCLRGLVRIAALFVLMHVCAYVFVQAHVFHRVADKSPAELIASPDDVVQWYKVSAWNSSSEVQWSTGSFRFCGLCIFAFHRHACICNWYGRKEEKVEKFRERCVYV